MNRKAVRAMLDLVADAESAESVESYHAYVLSALVAVFPCEVAVFNEFQLDPRPRRPGHPVVTCSRSPPIEPPGALGSTLLSAFVRHMTEHPLIRRHAIGDAARIVSQT